MYTYYVTNVGKLITYYSDLHRFAAALVVPEDGTQYKQNNKQHQRCNKALQNAWPASVEHCLSIGFHQI